MTSRPPDQNTPPPSPSTSSSAAQPRFRRLYDKLRSSLLKPRKFLSILYPFIHCFISKTLDYITIDTMYLHDGDNNVIINNSPLRLGWGPSEPEVEEEKLFFVPYRWWSEATESLGESIDVNGVLYTANSSLKDADIWGEIVIDLRSVDGSDHNKSGCSGGGGRAYALVAGTHLAVGTRKGKVQIWDASRCKKIRTMVGHGSRVGALAWGSSLLSSGSKDTSILQRDVRAREDFVSKLTGHKLEICGLKWSYDNRELASGGNDNKLFIWNLNSTQPVVSFCEHIAAVKAIAWSPHLYGLLASGGGTADRCIRFWNTTTNTHLSSIDTGSQVCNLVWSKNVNELVSTHGYSQNEIMVWRYPTMSKLATLIGHNCRVLYLAISPDGQTIVTGAGDETLKLWNVFPSPKSQNTEREIRSSFLGRTLIR